MIEMRKTQEAGKTPAQITVSMIDQDLKDGINKTEMAVKYGIKPWEVDEMFKHPLLKGRRPARKRVLSFSFVDDMTTNTTEEVTVDPNQVTLEQAIDEAIIVVEEVKDQMQETQEAITDMLSPTEFETEVTGLPKGETANFIEKTLKAAEEDEFEIPSFNDTMSLVEEQEWEKNGTEEELEMDDDTFEL
tara:strand:- start:896 stop:1462 length:567 start_codon:yes stop_codon:yes gene_type:complete